jgi:hypothetical protein
MRNRRAAIRISSIIAIVALFFGQSGARALAAPLFNGGFESGDLSGWIVGTGRDGVVNVVTEYQPDGSGKKYTGDGKYFALLTSGEPQVWTTLRQTFDVAAGASISCRTFYVPPTGKHAGDTAELRVLASGTVIGTPFSMTGEATNATGPGQWTEWHQSVSQAGRYVIEARVENSDLSTDPGYLGLDACRAGTSGPANPADFTLQPNGTDVEVAWQTAPGSPYNGFNIYRATSSTGDFEKINDVPIPAETGGQEMQTFSYVDSPGQGSFYYKLEAVADGGNQTFGPNSTDAAPADGAPARLPFRRPLRRPIPPAG